MQQCFLDIFVCFMYNSLYIKPCCLKKVPQMVQKINNQNRSQIQNDTNGALLIGQTSARECQISLYHLMKHRKLPRTSVKHIVNPLISGTTNVLMSSSLLQTNWRKILAYRIPDLFPLYHALNKGSTSLHIFEQMDGNNLERVKYKISRRI